MNNLLQSNIKNLLMLELLIDQLDSSLLTKNLTILSGSSIGQHIRHILEFYDCLFINSMNTICYDKRKRKLELEESIECIKENIKSNIERINGVKVDSPIIVEMSFSQENEDFDFFKSSFFRELSYCLDHAIHHIAVIKIALKDQNKTINIPSNFGVSYSTIRNSNKCAQ